MTFRYHQKAAEFDDMVGETLRANEAAAAEKAEASSAPDTSNGLARIAEMSAEPEKVAFDLESRLTAHRMVNTLVKKASASKNLINGFLKLTENGD